MDIPLYHQLQHVAAVPAVLASLLLKSHTAMCTLQCNFDAGGAAQLANACGVSSLSGSNHADKSSSQLSNQCLGHEPVLLGKHCSIDCESARLSNIAHQSALQQGSDKKVVT